MINESNKHLVVVFMLGIYILLTGCATVDGVREDVSKPFKWVGKVGDKIAPCKETNNDKCVKDE